MVASIQSPTINAELTQECEIRFQYRSLSISTLQVLVNHNLRHVSFGKFEEWTELRITIGAETPPILITITSESKNHYNHPTDVSLEIDNLRLFNCDMKKQNVTKPMKMSELYCDFENDLCGWEIPGEANMFSWFRTNSDEIEPGNDHTCLIRPKPSKCGYWLTTTNLESMAIQNQIRSQRILRPQPGRNHFCVMFWYYFFGIRRSIFEVFIQDAKRKTNTSVWLRIIPNVRSWQKAFIEIEAESDFFLFIESDPSDLTIGGLDDIVVTDRECINETPEFCDFEINYCDWRATYDVKRLKGHGTLADHTTETIYGHFLKTMGKNNNIYQKLSNLPYFPPGNNDDIDLCLIFYVYVFSDSTQIDKISSITIRQERYNLSNILYRIYMDEMSLFNTLNQWVMVTTDIRATREDVIKVQILRDTEDIQILLDDFSIRPNFCPKDGSCDFEYDMCGWRNKKVAEADFQDTILWIRVQPINRFAQESGMPFDHTTNSARGNYLVLPFNSQSRNRRPVVIKSPMIPRINPTICFEMYYFAQASSSLPALLVEMIDLTKTDDYPVSRFLNTSRTLHWQQFKIELTNLPISYAFKISALYDNRISSDIGIDDITILQQPCDTHSSTMEPSPRPPILKGDCDFERNNSCRWKFDQKHWQITSFQEDNRQKMYIPPEDHTYGSNRGHYLLYNQNSSKLSTPVTLDSPFFDYKFDTCLTLYYYHDGEEEFELILDRILIKEDMKIIHEVSTYGYTIEARRWQMARVNLPYDPANNFTHTAARIVYIPPENSNLFQIFAIDDIRIDVGACPHHHGYTYSFSETLEDLLIGQIHPENKAIALSIYPNRQERFDDVPQFDHTTFNQNGHYLLFKNQISIHDYFEDYLVMHHLPIELDEVCVRFAYQSNGPAALEIYVVPQTDKYDFKGKYKPIWGIKNYKEFWTIKEINFALTIPSQLIMRFYKSDGEKNSFVAIDDLSVVQYSCEPEIDCDFDDGHYCSYSIYRDDQTNYNFEVFHSLTNDVNWPGPEYDHTSGSARGQYLFLTAYRTNKRSGSLRAKIVSGSREIFPDDHCLSMWTIIKGSDTLLRVSILRYGLYYVDQNRTIDAFHIVGVEHSDWHRNSFTISKSMVHNADEIQILIEGVIQADHFAASIAIDDINLFSGPCEDFGLQCEDGRQISEDEICDFVRDCKSGIDELNCGACDFETGRDYDFGKQNFFSKFLLFLSIELR